MKRSSQGVKRESCRFPESPDRLMRSIMKRVTDLSRLGPEIIGSLCSRSGKCANPDCPCHRGERMHVSWQLTSTAFRRTRTVYVPLESLETVREWAGNHKEGQRLRREMSDLCERYLRTLVPKERATKRRSSRKSAKTEEVQND